jgi:predicted  nucleic acid-binding Zn-ribbon protein
MNEPDYHSAPQPDRFLPSGDSPILPNLGSTLGEECDTLQDNLRQVNEVAAGLNEELAGKSKQLKHLSFLIEQARAHLGHMRDSIAVMRKERHKLANTVMAAPMVSQMLSRVTAERDKLRNELNRIREGQTAGEPEQAQRGLRFDERDQQIADLTFELVTLRQQMAEVRRNSPPPAPIANEPTPVPPAEGKMRVGADRDDFPTRVVFRKSA